MRRCIFQLERCFIPISRPPDVSGGRHLENEMYISSEKMYISTGQMIYSYLAAARYIWRPPLRGEDVYFKWKDLYFNQ